YAAFPSAIFPGVGLGFLIGWAVLFPILKAIVIKTGKGLPTGTSRPRTFWGPFLWGAGMGSGGWRSGGGGWSSGGGGGGFSGGGGSFGGGGSSGSW
ncbi:MAG TPA: hypothetical protein VE078_06225, partial [Thermoanaerobaculia bacterium]|nr:hypothetical protein [Thermoanaerobaculia bacterium]